MILAVNRKANYDYEILEKFEAGMVLLGHEVKAIREGKMSLQGAYARIKNGEIFLCEANIAPYSKAGQLFAFDPKRERKLLLNKKEIQRISGLLQNKSLTLIPLKVYTKGRYLKIEIGLARGKKKYEKKEKIKEKESKLEAARALKIRG